MSKNPHYNFMNSVASWHFKVARLLDLSGQCYFSGPFQSGPLPGLSSLVSAWPPWASASLNCLTSHTSFSAFI